MAEDHDFIDYYKVLQCDRDVTSEEIKKNYQRLVLSLHPDKTDSGNQDKGFILLQKAWSILRDPKSRKQYDATLTCHENTELLLYDTIKLSDMTIDSSETVYTYNCRCGGTYLLDVSDTIPTQIVIGCDECSFSILIQDE